VSAGLVERIVVGNLALNVGTTDDGKRFRDLHLL
jgi:hypothetical protein